MKSLIVLISAAVAFGQQPDRKSVPIYNVTVIERTIKAVNYQYRSGPTLIDFRGTVPSARGKRRRHRRIQARPYGNRNPSQSPDAAAALRT